jgi:hypothetical protein
MGNACCRDDLTSTEFECDVDVDVESTPSLPEAKTFEITLTRGDDTKMGLDIDHYPNAEESMAIRIKSVKEGLVSEWNAQQPSMAVKEGDLITMCNGKAGKSQDMLKLMGSSNELSLTIMRPEMYESAEELELEIVKQPGFIKHLASTHSVNDNRARDSLSADAIRLSSRSSLGSSFGLRGMWALRERSGMWKQQVQQLHVEAQSTQLQEVDSPCDASASIVPSDADQAPQPGDAKTGHHRVDFKCGLRVAFKATVQSQVDSVRRNLSDCRVNDVVAHKVNVALSRASSSALPLKQASGLLLQGAHGRARAVTLRAASTARAAADAAAARASSSLSSARARSSWSSARSGTISI